MLGGWTALLKSVVHKVREKILRFLNLRTAVKFKSAIAANGTMPVCIIASRPDYHLAPLAIERNHPKIQSIVLANGVSGSQLDWLRRECGSTPVIPLRASFRSSSRSFLSHAGVISIANSISNGDYCIQDADCFVTDTAWWDYIIEDRENVYASGPFGKPFNDLPGQFPDTFLVRIDRANYIDVCQKFEVEPSIVTRPSPRVRRELDSRGIQENWFPDYKKQYYDTLQLFWTAAALSGLDFNLLPGANEQVFHVGGSSYLTTAEIRNPSHWDWWAVNTIYFHLKILESERFDEIRDDFGLLFSRFESSDKVLSIYPEYLNSRRYYLCVKLLSFLQKRLGLRPSSISVSG